MANISLRWIETNALIEWAERHFYYLPESVIEPDIWCSTMQALISELNENGMSIEAHIYANETTTYIDEPNYESWPYTMVKYNTPTKIGDKWYLRDGRDLFELVTVPQHVPAWRMISTFGE